MVKVAHKEHISADQYGYREASRDYLKNKSRLNLNDLLKRREQEKKNDKKSNFIILSGATTVVLVVVLILSL